MSYLKDIHPSRTPQSQPISADQVQNNAGGYVFGIDDWEQFKRFLILGSEGGTYYVGEQELSLENSKTASRCIEEDGARAVNLIVEISVAGRAPKNDPAIYALALACSALLPQTRKLALDSIPLVCRTGTHLFTFIGYIENMRGWGRGLRNAVAAWYEQEGTPYQLVKYRQRGGWTHRDVLRLCKPRPERGSEIDNALRWAVGKPLEFESLPKIVQSFELAQRSRSPRETAVLIGVNPDLPREALNTEHLNSPEVWTALLENGMPLTAMIRNLATMTRAGVLDPMSKGASTVVAELGNVDRLRASRVHPLAVLNAAVTYNRGVSTRGSNSWVPTTQIVDALNKAFYDSFGNVRPTNKRTMLALDVSGSMSALIGDTALSARAGSAAMALVTAAVEPNHVITAFSHSMVPVTISPRQRIDDVISATDNLPFGRTDCAQPMMYAMNNGMAIDTFVIYTDNETWYGGIHPIEALRAYRTRMGINAKLIVVGMTATKFSIADPSDPGMLDVVGFDSATPAVISEFSAA